MPRTSLGLVWALLGLASLSCGGRTGIRLRSSDAGSSTEEPAGTEPGTASRRPLSDDGTCPASYAVCGSGKAAKCVLVENDPMNCGACGHACAAGIACVAGSCQQRKCTGPLTFQRIASYPPNQPPPYPGDAWYGAYTDADVNQDGHLDFIERVDTLDEKTGQFIPGKSVVWLGHSDGTFEVSNTDYPGVKVCYAGDGTCVAGQDFNEDGLADLLVTNADSTRISIRLGLPGGGWGAPVDSISGDPRITPLMIGDLNGDGYVDLIASRYNGDHHRMIELLSRGDGTFASPHKLDMDDGFPSRLLDWNGDGILDILFDGSALRIAYGKGDGSFGEVQRCPAGIGGSAPAIASAFLDLNQDGHIDMLGISGRSKRLGTAFGQGGCSFTPRTDYVFSYDLIGLVMGDLDGDGVLDVLVGGRFADPNSYSFDIKYLTTTALLIGRPDGSFARQPDLEIPWQENGGFPIITEVNGDGRADIVTTGRAGIAVYANTCVAGS